MFVYKDSKDPIVDLIMSCFRFIKLNKAITDSWYYTNRLYCVFIDEIIHDFNRLIETNDTKIIVEVLKKISTDERRKNFQNSFNKVTIFNKQSSELGKMMDSIIFAEIERELKNLNELCIYGPDYKKDLIQWRNKLIRHRDKYQELVKFNDKPSVIEKFINTLYRY